MPVQQDGARDGLQVARGRAEKLASSRWPQPVAKTRPRCDIQQRDRGHRQADRPSARNRRRLTGSGRHQNLAIAPGALTMRSARAIEERFFREEFRREWIVAVAPPEGAASGMLLAIDGNQRIIGANRFARTSLMLDDRGLRAGTSLWSIFERDIDLFRRQDRTDISARLLIAGSSDSRPALVTPPDHPVTASSNPTNSNLHT